ncbi:hypothetical protein HMPREF0063_12726 [Aeromicrobium marinum DSM 15272]|uniref:Uncharacterized protein n=1 Tax=Aeromicrobium marinum DSM 15272 TaxID=585531 RepID=E2SFB7_9ACTN|nr:hypothetical protein [Aeromicrobium marinum]EFQ82202.1 hypothetical protein HMPREF0063_12726 [Aeromicrobium marinum DSM 15272]
MISRYALLVAVTVPPLITAATGLTHPPVLTVEDAPHWQMMHTVLLPIFPLLALGPWLVAREVDRGLAVLVGVLGFVYACFYTSLDVLAGIGGGAIKAAEAGGLGIIFPVAGDLGAIGSYAYFGAAAIACGMAARRTGWFRAAPGIVLVLVGAWMFWQEHVYRPWGVLSMVLLAAGWAWLALGVTRDRESHQEPATV